MVFAVKNSQWRYVSEAIEKSRQLLQATLFGDEEAVARGIEAAHDENSLSCVLSLAYYYARNNYIIHRELATGKVLPTW